MTSARFISDGQRLLFDAVVSCLGRVGYRGELLALNYQYVDYLAPNTPQREIQAACFGRLPADYETALVGVALANGQRDRELVNSHRALASPLILEVGDEQIGVWSIGASEGATRRTHWFSGDEFANWIDDNAEALAPTQFLRTKNIRQDETQWFQGSLFAGLIPELEQNIAGILEPRLTAAFRAGMNAYESETGRPPQEATLFKLAFWLLTGKVYFDRQHKGFRGLGRNPDPDEVIERVAAHYDEPIGRLLTESTRRAVFSHIWTQMDFRHLSVEVLSQIWSRTLVTKETRERLGIHRTPYSLVRYLVDRVPLEPLPEPDEFIVEPCCGSAVFLVAALNRMRDIIGTELSALDRHKYFRRVLRGFEKDDFAVEIAKLCLALSDYPNANHWLIDGADVLKSPQFDEALQSARVVLCNPPYGAFSKKEQREYGESAHVYKPVAILSHVLDSLCPNGSLGFVLPRVFIDSSSYRVVRKRIAERFSSIELVTLPDSGWEYADQETVLLIATEPNQGSARRTQVTHKKVREGDWPGFNLFHRVGSEDAKSMTPDEASESLAIPDLENLWHHLRNRDTVGMKAEVHRGIEWNKELTKEKKETGWRDRLIQRKEFPNSRLGIPPMPKRLFSKAERTLYSFSAPSAKRWLDMSDENRKGNAHDYAWDEPKVVVNAVTRSRGKWRMAAFADTERLVCYQNLTAIWPHNADDLLVLTAVLNGPLANAYATSHEGKRHITNETIEAIPLPYIDEKLRRDVGALVAEYLSALREHDEELLVHDRYGRADEVLRLLDARVLRAYQLTPQQERLLLDYFNDDHIHYGRQVPFTFTDYFPQDMEMQLTLHEYLSPKRRRSTMGRLLGTAKAPPSVRDALKGASEIHTQ